MERAIPNLPADDLHVAKDFYVGKLEVDDTNALYDPWRGQVELSRPPRNEEWGGRTFGVTDPFGTLLYVVGPVK